MKLLSPLQVLLNDAPLPLPLIGKGLALFAYVATHDQPCPRTTLLDLLWSDVTEKQARENLRSLLYSVHQILGDYVLVTRHTVALNRHLPYWLDVEVFSSMVDHPRSEDPLLLAQALDLYKQDFLNDFHLSNAPVFESWLAEERRQLRRRAIEGWQKLVRYYSTHDRFEEGLSANARLLTLAPWHEEAHRQQMRLLLQTGQRSAALAQYEICRRQLREDLDAPPSAETTALYERIKAETSATPNPIRVAEHKPSWPAADTRIRIDRGSMPTPRWFLGRQQELRTLQQWIVTERCRVTSILGMGGQGKTTLAAHFVQSLAKSATETEPPFEVVIWHSLLNAPPLEEILRDWIYQLSDQTVVSLPPTLDRQLDLLSEHLQRRRFLFVLDNAESLISAATAENSEAYNDYLRLWRTFLDRPHRCCLLITAREWASRQRNQYEQQGLYRQLILDGLPPKESTQLLKNHGLQGSNEDFFKLQHIYSGNPLALDLVAQTIDEIFDGNVRAFIAEDSPFLSDIDAVLEQQISRLSPLEQEILIWLALEQEPVTNTQLWDNLLAPPSKREYLTALNNLLQRSLIQQEGPLFGVQNVILEYLSGRLQDDLYRELTNPELSEWIDPLVLNGRGEANPRYESNGNGARSKLTRVTQMMLNRYALNKAQTKEHIRAGQRRLLLAPLIKRLQQYWGGPTGVEKLFNRLLISLRSEQQMGAPLTNGYAAGNIFSLLHQLNDNVCTLDFSHLTLRQVDLSKATIHHCDLTHAVLRDCIYMSDFSSLTALAFHPEGEWLAAATLSGEIRLWRLRDQQFFALLCHHQSPATALSISPDGQWLASSSVDGLLCLWDLKTYQLCRSYQHLANRPHGLAFSPDSQWLAIVDEAGIDLYAVESGEKCGRLDSRAGHMRSVAVSPNGQWVAVGANRGEIHLWQIGSSGVNAWMAAPTAVLHSGDKALNALLFSADGQLLYSGGEDGLIRQWEMAQIAGRPDNGVEPRVILRGHSSGVHALTLCHNGECLASGGADGVIHLWDMPSGQLIDTLMGHTQLITGMIFQPPSAQSRRRHIAYLLVSASLDQRLNIWEVDRSLDSWRGRLSGSLVGYTAAQESCVFGPDGRTLFSAGYDGKVRAWDAATGQLDAVLYDHPTWITALNIDPTGSALAWSGYDHAVWVTSLPAVAGQPVARRVFALPGAHHPKGNVAAIYGMDFSPDGQWLATGSTDHTLCLWNVPQSRLWQTLPEHIDAVWAVVFSPDGQILASGGRDGVICLWSWADLDDPTAPTLRLSHKLTEHRGPVRDLRFTPDGLWLVSASSDKTVRIWDRGGNMNRVLTGHTASVGWLAVSPRRLDGQLTLASCDQNRRLCIWDFDSGDLIHTWQEPGGRILKLNYSPDGKWLAGANFDGYIRLWDVKSGDLIRTFEIAKPYAGMTISGVTGVTAAQKAVLRSLGAVDQEANR